MCGVLFLPNPVCCKTDFSKVCRTPQIALDTRFGYKLELFSCTTGPVSQFAVLFVLPICMNKISRSIVARLLTKPCPALIPRTGPTAKEINCYALSLFEAENPRLLISGITETGFEGKFWNGSEFNAQATVPFRYFPGLTLRIDHYHGLVHHTLTPG